MSELAQETASVMMCALRIRDAIFFSLEKKDTIYLDAGVEVKLMDRCNCTICTWTCFNGCDHPRWLVGIAC